MYAIRSYYDQGFARFLGGRQVWWHRSARLDYLFYFLRPLLHAIFIAPALLWLSPVLLTTDNVIQVLSAWFSENNAQNTSTTVMFLYGFGAFLVNDFTHYWVHRAFHSRWLWEFHKVHHSAVVMVPVTASRITSYNVCYTKLLRADLPLGIYECPVPFRRLLTDDELMYCANTGRFIVLKDVSCDLETVTRRVQLVKDTPLAIINANAAIAFDAMKAGSKGFSGVFTNFHPDLYHWLYHSHQTQPEYAQQLAWFLSMSAMGEAFGYPKNAKVFHQQLGTFQSPHCRVTQDDVLTKYWALGTLLDQIKAASDWHRAQIAHFTGE